MTVLPKGAAIAGGDLRAVYVHWTAGDYATAFDAYHLCVVSQPSLGVVLARDPRENMRDVAREPQRPYAAHTAGRNAYALGVAVCAMRNATPADFGAFPLLPPAVALLCDVVAEACALYRIPIDGWHVRTHAEAALEDGYFGTGDGERWDIARLAPQPHPLRQQEVTQTADALRARVQARAAARR